MIRPTYKAYIQSAQLSKEAAEYYMGQFNEKSINTHLYPGAWFDCNINIKTRYMETLSDDEIKQLDKDMEIFLDPNRIHTSDSAIIYNYIIGKNADTELVSKLIKKLISFNNRFTFMLLMSQPQLGYNYFYNLMKVILYNISTGELKALQNYIRDFNTFNSDLQAVEIINNLKKDFHEL